MNQKLVFYGGTFDPVHIGHFQTITVLSENFDQVAVVIGENYLKASPLLDYDFRFNCLKKITSNLKNVVILDLRGKCDQSSTYSVLLYLENIYKIKPTISFGSDCLINIEKWKNFDILKTYDYFVFKRNDDWKDLGLSIALSPVTIDSISSTDIKINRLYEKIPVEIRELIISKMI